MIWECIYSHLVFHRVFLKKTWPSCFWLNSLFSLCFGPRHSSERVRVHCRIYFQKASVLLSISVCSGARARGVFLFLNVDWCYVEGKAPSRAVRAPVNPDLVLFEEPPTLGEPLSSLLPFDAYQLCLCLAALTVIIAYSVSLYPLSL